MKITSQKFQQSISSLATDGNWSCLLYGPNGGLVNVITDQILSSFQGKSPTVTKMYGQDIEKDRSELFNSVLNMSLFASFQVILIKDASNKTFTTLSELATAAKQSGINIKDQTFIVVAAEALDTKSKLRLYYEKEADTLCVPCYDDDKNATAMAIKEFLSANQIQYTDDLVSRMAMYFGGDRGVLMNDLSIFALYLGDKKTFTIEDVENVFYDSTSVAMDELVDAVFDGQAIRADEMFQKILDSDGQLIAVLRSMIGHLKSIRSMKELVMGGSREDEVIQSARVFFRRVPSYKRHIKFALPLIDDILCRLADLEISIKKYSKHDGYCIAMISRAMISICARARLAK